MSFEHEISVVSAITLKKVLEGFALRFIFVSAEREFYLIDAAQMKSTYFSKGGYKKAKKLRLAKGGFEVPGVWGAKKLDTECLINLIHGQDGEDGKMASLFDFYNVPYIGPGIEASVLSYNKLLTKLYAQSLGVKTMDYQLLRRGETPALAFDLPVIIKPARLGSSIGVSIVKEPGELEYALDVAFEFDTEVLVEPFIKDVREFNLAGYKAGDFALSIIENPQKEEFLDFDKKYLDFSRDGKPEAAKLPEPVASAMQEAFKKIYGSLFEGSLIRCDFFVIENEVYLNEINPIPGSMANYLFEDFKTSIAELAQKLPRKRTIMVDYLYINKIQSSKGKV
jgi:D-alanine-D-alanine ligase